MHKICMNFNHKRAVFGAFFVILNKYLSVHNWFVDFMVKKCYNLNIDNYKRSDIYDYEKM